MALKLVEEMSEKWKPEAFADTYRDDLMKRIEQKVKAGQTHTLTEPEAGSRGARHGRRQGRGSHVAAGEEPRAERRRLPAKAPREPRKRKHSAARRRTANSRRRAPRLIHGRRGTSQQGQHAPQAIRRQARLQEDRRAFSQDERRVAARNSSSSCRSTPRADCTGTFAWSGKARCVVGPCPKGRRSIPPTSDWRSKSKTIPSRTRNSKETSPKASTAAAMSTSGTTAPGNRSATSTRG